MDSLKLLYPVPRYDEAGAPADKAEADAQTLAAAFQRSANRDEWLLNRTAALALAAFPVGSAEYDAALETLNSAAVKTAEIVDDAAELMKEWANAPQTLLHGTSAQRRALVVNPPRHLLFLETDNGRTLTYYPGVGWRDVYGGDPDAAPPPPDTGEY